MPFKGWSICSSGTWLAQDWHANVLSIRTTNYIYATVNEQRLGRYCCSGFWLTVWSSWWSVWLLFLTQAVGSQGLTLGEVICHEGSWCGGCLDKMTPSQTPGLPFKMRQMGPNSQTCPHQLYKKKVFSQKYLLILQPFQIGWLETPDLASLPPNNYDFKYRNVTNMFFSPCDSGKTSDMAWECKFLLLLVPGGPRLAGRPLLQHLLILSPLGR